MDKQENEGRKEDGPASIRQTNSLRQEYAAEAQTPSQVLPQPSLPQSSLGSTIIVISPMGWLIT